MRNEASTLPTVFRRTCCLLMVFISLLQLPLAGKTFQPSAFLSKARNCGAAPIQQARLCGLPQAMQCLACQANHVATSAFVRLIDLNFGPMGI